MQNTAVLNLVCLNQNEDIVHAHCKDKKGDDLYDDESSGHAHIAVEPKGSGH